MSDGYSQEKEARSIDALNKFVGQDPNAMYTFDAPAGVPRAELCRGKNCVTLDLYSTKMFECMQKLGFYCALPMDPGRTHMECRPLPK
ncbi:hypothetical protein K523DRAFT_277834 [Schizophyllum commune Tattone D]|nr:hypothetical protein K523DRAFT_277834 [Schizophyllum commune Tattone D]